MRLVIQIIVALFLSCLFTISNSFSMDSLKTFLFGKAYRTSEDVIIDILKKVDHDLSLRKRHGLNNQAPIDFIYHLAVMKSIEPSLESSKHQEDKQANMWTYKKSFYEGFGKDNRDHESEHDSLTLDGEALREFACANDHFDFGINEESHSVDLDEVWVIAGPTLRVRSSQNSYFEESKKKMCSLASRKHNGFQDNKEIMQLRDQITSKLQNRF